MKYKIIRQESFSRRLLGLMFRKNIKVEEYFFFERCKSVHTCFLRFKIDVIGVDENYRVVQIEQNVEPWKLVILKKNTKHILERKARHLDKELAIGYQFEME